MAPKAAKPDKRSLILAYFHRTGVAHTLKDLEKALPSIASINGMQVNEHLNGLLDEDLITKEKIGSGNWYWSFVAAEAITKQARLESVTKELGGIRQEIEECEEEIREKEEESAAAAADEDGGKARVEAERKIEDLIEKVKGMRDELVRYADDDPLEMERRVKALRRVKDEVLQVTEEIESMEGYLIKSMFMDREMAKNQKKQWYDLEWSEEEQALKDLPFA